MSQSILIQKQMEDLAEIAAQLELQRQIDQTTFNLSVYCAANQSVTIGKGATFSLN